MPRAQKPSSKTAAARHDPLHVQLQKDAQDSGPLSKPGRRKSRHSKAGDDEDENVVIDPKTSRKIFELAKDQQNELRMDDGADSDGAAAEDEHAAKMQQHRQPAADSDDEDFGSDRDVDEEVYEELEIDEADMHALDALLPSNSGERRTLADMILNKLDQADAGEYDSDGDDAVSLKSDSDAAPDPAEGLNPKVVEAYTRIGHLLAAYRSGPLPKLFKLLPSMPQWARLLALTQPERWTPHATRAATRIFVSNLKPAQARVFLEGVVLPAVRADMREHAGRLNVHLYEALKKAIYKPAAFFKGILFPLCEGGCTLKEAAVLSSVMARVSIPIMHSAAALGRLAQLEYSGPTSLFIRVLLDKKYALPYKVLDRLWEHFVRLANAHKTQGTKLPVLWHQSLLVFVQRYASNLSADQKDALLDVVRVAPHPQIGPEVRREILAAGERPVAGTGPTQDVEMSG
ncbi:Bystin-domain-containing protein [Auricularia subglabra TFB-10046 SS5]|nr:Bystin-domain-containing protein [Auricularia subglabra TFB-10046 SS5]